MRVQSSCHPDMERLSSGSLLKCVVMASVDVCCLGHCQQVLYGPLLTCVLWTSVNLCCLGQCQRCVFWTLLTRVLWTSVNMCCMDQVLTCVVRTIVDMCYMDLCQHGGVWTSVSVHCLDHCQDVLYTPVSSCIMRVNVKLCWGGWIKMCFSGIHHCTNFGKNPWVETLSMLRAIADRLHAVLKTSCLLINRIIVFLRFYYFCFTTYLGNTYLFGLAFTATDTTIMS